MNCIYEFCFFIELKLIFMECLDNVFRHLIREFDESNIDLPDKNDTLDSLLKNFCKIIDDSDGEIEENIYTLYVFMHNMYVNKTYPSCKTIIESNIIRYIKQLIRSTFNRRLKSRMFFILGCLVYYIGTEEVLDNIDINFLKESVLENINDTNVTFFVYQLTKKSKIFHSEILDIFPIDAIIDEINESGDHSLYLFHLLLCICLYKINDESVNILTTIFIKILDPNSALFKDSFIISSIESLYLLTLNSSYEAVFSKNSIDVIQRLFDYINTTELLFSYFNLVNFALSSGIIILISFQKINNTLAGVSSPDLIERVLRYLELLVLLDHNKVKDIFTDNFINLISNLLNETCYMTKEVLVCFLYKIRMFINPYMLIPLTRVLVDFIEKINKNNIKIYVLSILESIYLASDNKTKEFITSLFIPSVVESLNELIENGIIVEKICAIQK